MDINDNENGDYMPATPKIIVNMNKLIIEKPPTHAVIIHHVLACLDAFSALPYSPASQYLFTLLANTKATIPAGQQQQHIVTIIAHVR